MSNVLYPLNLQFFNADSEGRTENATSKKREDARKKGQVAKSIELNTAFILMAFFFAMSMLGDYYLNQIMVGTTTSINNIPEILHGFNEQTIEKVVGEAVKDIIVINGPLWAILFTVAFLVSIIQVGYKPTFKPLAPKFNKLNPLSGLKKMVSKDMIVELIKGIGKVIFLGAIFLSVTKEVVPIFLNFYDMTTMMVLENLGEVVMKIGMNVGGAFLFLAVIDYGYQKYKFEDGIKMTKQEIKDEYKQSEGDPHIKGKIRQKMREMSMKRMMQAIPEADVIITNPTHFAIAISYKPGEQLAPIVVAKGVDFMAQKIKEKAKEHKVHIVENKPLARTLYYTVEIGRAIPPELYNAVAEVLAFVYNLNEKKRK